MTVNEITLVGEVLEGFSEYRGKYLATISVERHSGQLDIIPVLFHRYRGNMEGRKILVVGQIRSEMNYDSKIRRNNFVWASEIVTVDDEAEDRNDVELVGKVISEVKARETPCGRSICDIGLKVQCNRDKYAIVPVIIWSPERNGFLKMVQKEDTIYIRGRLQSRSFTKVSKGTREFFEIREVSSIEFKIIEKGKKE